MSALSATSRSTISKAENEQRRNGVQKTFISQMKRVLIANGHGTEEAFKSQELVLFKVDQLISSVNLHDSFPPFKFSELSGQEKRNKAEQYRRNKMEAAIVALREFFVDVKLVNLTSRIKLERVTVLEVSLKFLKDLLGASDSTGKSTRPSISPLMFTPPVTLFAPIVSHLSPTQMQLSNVLTQNTTPLLTQNSLSLLLLPLFQNILQWNVILYNSLWKDLPNQFTVKSDESVENRENQENYDEEIDVMG